MEILVVYFQIKLNVNVKLSFLKIVLDEICFNNYGFHRHYIIGLLQYFIIYLELLFSYSNIN